MDKLEFELKKALTYLTSHWKMQNNYNDYRTNFIYNITTFDEVVDKARDLDVELSYVMHRWYNFHTSIKCEEIFIKYGAIKEENKKHKEVDIYINNTPFDVKLTVYPKKLSDHPFNIRTRQGKNAMIKWLYHNQSQQGRKHLKNRLFIVCNSMDGTDNIRLKCEFSKIENKIKLFMQHIQKNGFNEIIIEDGGKEYKVFSEVINVE